MYDDQGNYVKHDVQSSDRVYYHKSYNRFFQVKEQTDDYYLIGGLCEYYTDSLTNITRAKVSYKFMKKSELVTCIDNYATYNGIGWRVPENDERSEV